MPESKQGFKASTCRKVERFLKEFTFAIFSTNHQFQSIRPQNGSNYAPLPTRKPLMKMSGFFGLKWCSDNTNQSLNDHFECTPI